MKKLFLSLIISMSMICGVYADNTQTPNTTNNEYVHHVYLSGATGTGLVTTGDVLAPLWLQYDRIFFFYGQGDYGYAADDWAKNPWAGSAGLGYREILDNFGVLGAYVFSDYTQTFTNHKIWQISPGIEFLGRAWEFHANGYIPL